LTDELRARVESELAAGASQAVVAQRVGVGARSLARWLAEGKVPVRESSRRRSPLQIRRCHCPSGLRKLSLR
jgi:hypothetical protein